MNLGGGVVTEQRVESMKTSSLSISSITNRWTSSFFALFLAAAAAVVASKSFTSLLAASGALVPVAAAIESDLRAVFFVLPLLVRLSLRSFVSSWENLF